MDQVTFTQVFAALFTPAQQVALAIITLAVVALTEVFKRVYFGFWPTRRKGKRVAILWLAAFSFGVVCGVGGYAIGEPPQPLWFWVFSGAASGWVAVCLFKLFVGVLWPRIKPFESTRK